jgi:Concanavalin A-like lectin/glucanases superfamily/FG-GAP repeat/Malectin domain
MRRYLLLLWWGAALALRAQPGPGYALRFNDTTSYVSVPHTSGLNAFPLTVMAWVKTSQTTGQQGLVNKYLVNSFNGWNLFLRDGRVRAWYFVNNTRFVWDGSNGLDGGSVADGQWHLVAFTVDASGGKLYVDGGLRASRTWNGASGAATTTQEVRLGNYPGGILSFNGSLTLDEISVWRIALNLSQIQINLFNSLTGAEADLLASYHCDEGGGTTVADSAPLLGDNNGTWAGTPLFVSTVVASKPQHDGGTPPSDCGRLPGVTEVRLDWRGQNLAGCKIDLDCSRSRIHRVAPDCATIYYADLPPEAPRLWTILSQPPGANAQITPTSSGATLTLPVAGDYTVQLTVCPGECMVPEPGGASTFPMVPSSGAITVRALTELPLRVQERPVLPPSAMVPTPRLDLPDSQRDCTCSGGGGYINPQWVTINHWNGPNDYRLVEGQVVRSWPSTQASLLNHDIAFGAANWYVLHDLNVVVSPDPSFYNLLSVKPEFESNPHLLSCVSQIDTIPERFRPVEGDRVSLFGYWILDCGHKPFYTEMHPVVGWAVHHNRAVRIPDDAQFTFDLVTNTVTAAAGNNLFVPGIITDLWFNSDAGGATGGDLSSLAQPGQSIPFICIPGSLITESPIQREYDFRIYLPKNPSQVFAEVGQSRPRAPLYLNISNPVGSTGPDPVVTRATESVRGVTYEYLQVHLDLRGHTASTYSRRIEAAWVYPQPDNWGLEQWRIALDRLDVYDDLDSKARWPSSDGDWVLWLMLPSLDQPWNRVLDGFENVHGTVTFDPPWETGRTDSRLQRPPISLDPNRALGSDVLSFGSFVNFWMAGYEADEGGDDGDTGRISDFVFNSGAELSASGDNDVFAATLTGTRLATLANGILSPAATELGRHYLLTCTNKINNRNPVLDRLNPFLTLGILAEGISGEPPLSPIDPDQIYGSGAALLGDVNGDGFPDVALGTRGANVEAHLFLGGRNGFSPAPYAVASISLSTSNSLSQGTRRTRTFTGASDLNGDGIPDLLIGTPTFNNTLTNEGAVFAFSGAQLATGATLGQNDALWAAAGNFPGGQFGYSVAAGDITHDGISDVVVAAPFYTNSPTPGRPLGRVFVFLGGSPSPATTPQQVLVPDLSTVSDYWFGYSVSMAGDVNSDGFTDVIIGAPHYTRTVLNQGAFFLYYGSPTGLVLNTFLLVEGGSANAQFGYAVAGVGDVDADGFPDVLVSAPFLSGSELTLENGYVALYRGSEAGLIPAVAWEKFGETGGAHFGTDLGPVGDMNGDGRMDVAIGAPDESGPDGMRGRVSFYLGQSSGLTVSETWRTWGVSGVARLMINSPCCVPFISECCITGTTNKVDFNIDGFADALTFDPNGGGDPFGRVQLVLGRGQKALLPRTEPFFAAGNPEPFAFQSISNAEFLADVALSGQTYESKIAAVLGKVKDLYTITRDQGGDPGSIVPMLQELEQVAPSNLFSQYFGGVDLELGTAFYIDCGATNEYTDALGRQWLPDAPFLATPNAAFSTFAIGPITNTLTGDPYLPDAMLNSERWFSGHVRYQVAVPNGWYTVLLYFSENYPPAVNPALGGTGCAACARIFDLEVEGQRVDGYNQADAALPPNGDGLGVLYTATQVPFNVQVSDGLLDVAVLDHGLGNPPENPAIKGMAILGRPDPATKFATRPRLAHVTRDAGQIGILVDPQANLARYLAGEIPLRLQSSPNLNEWATLPDLPEVGAEGAFFSLSLPTNNASFYRAVITPP